MHSPRTVGLGWSWRMMLSCLIAIVLSWSSSTAQAGWKPGSLIKKWMSKGKKHCPSDLDGEEAPDWHPCRLREWPGKSFQGRGGGEHTFRRAGYPNEISKLAHPTDTGNYIGYYVGGGSAFKKHSGGPGPRDGTFGWDYAGLLPKWKKNIMLRWGNRYQGGVGRYETDDGPQVVDVGPYIAEIQKGPRKFRQHEGEGEGEGH